MIAAAFLKLNYCCSAHKRASKEEHQDEEEDEEEEKEAEANAIYYCFTLLVSCLYIIMCYVLSLSGGWLC